MNEERKKVIPSKYSIIGYLIAFTLLGACIYSQLNDPESGRAYTYLGIAGAVLIITGIVNLIVDHKKKGD